MVLGFDIVSLFGSAMMSLDLTPMLGAIPLIPIAIGVAKWGGIGALGLGVWFGFDKVGEKLGIGSLTEMLTRFVGGWLYYIWSCFAAVVDTLEGLFRMIAGIKPLPSKKGELGTVTGDGQMEPGGDIVSRLIQDSTVQAIFQNLIIVAVVLLMFFTILQIIREQYMKKDGGNPYMTVFKMFKGMITMLFITAVVLVGLYTSGIILNALDKATGGGKETPISGQIFKAMAHNANVLRAGDPNEYTQNQKAANSRQSNYDLVADKNRYSGDRLGFLNQYNYFESSKAKYAPFIPMTDTYINVFGTNGKPYASNVIGQGAMVYYMQWREYTFTWGDPNARFGSAGNPLYYLDTGGAKAGNKDNFEYVFDHQQILNLFNVGGGTVIPASLGGLNINRLAYYLKDPSGMEASARVPNTNEQKDDVNSILPQWGQLWDYIYAQNMILHALINGGWSSNRRVNGTTWLLGNGPFFGRLNAADNKNNMVFGGSQDAQGYYNSFTFRVPYVFALESDIQYWDTNIGVSVRNYSLNAVKNVETLKRYPGAVVYVDEDAKAINSGGIKPVREYGYQDVDNIMGLRPFTEGTRYLYVYSSSSLGRVIGNAPATYRNTEAVNALYYIDGMDYILGYLGIFIIIGVFLNFTFGLIQRIVELLILYMLSPITLAMYPFDDGASFKSNFFQPFYKKVIAVYAIILSLNLFFVIYPLITGINFFEVPRSEPIERVTEQDIKARGNLAANRVMYAIIAMALFAMLPKIRSTIANMLGADQIEEKSLKSTFLDAKKALDAGGMSLAARGVKNTFGAIRKAKDYATLDREARMAEKKENWVNEQNKNDPKFLEGKTPDEINALFNASQRKDRFNPMAIARAGLQGVKNTKYLRDALFDFDNGELMQGAFGNFIRNRYDPKTRRARIDKLAKAQLERRQFEGQENAEGAKLVEQALGGRDEFLEVARLVFGDDAEIEKIMKDPKALAELINSQQYQDKKSEYTNTKTNKIVEAAGGEQGLRAAAEAAVLKGKSEEEAKQIRANGTLDAAVDAKYKEITDAIGAGGKTANDFMELGLGGNLAKGIEEALAGSLVSLQNVNSREALKIDAKAIISALTEKDRRLKFDENSLIDAISTAIETDDTSALKGFKFDGLSQNKNAAAVGTLLQQIGQGTGHQDYLNRQESFKTQASEFATNADRLRATEKLGDAHSKMVNAESTLMQAGGMDAKTVDALYDKYSQAKGNAQRDMMKAIDSGQGEDGSGFITIRGARRKIIDEDKDILKEEWKTEKNVIYGESVRKEVQKNYKFADYDYSMKHGQRMEGAYVSSMGEENIKIQEQVFSSMDIGNRNTMVQNKAFMKYAAEGKWSSCADEFYKIANGQIENCIEDLRNDAKMQQMARTAQGREDARRMAGLMSKMYGDVKGMMAGNTIMNADNVVGSLMQMAFLEKLKDNVDGGMQMNANLEHESITRLNEMQQSALNVMKSVKNKYGKDLGEVGNQLLKAIEAGSDTWGDTTVNTYFDKVIETLRDKRDNATGVDYHKLQEQVSILERMQSNRVDGLQKANRAMDAMSAFRGAMLNQLGYFYRIFQQDSGNK